MVDIGLAVKSAIKILDNARQTGKVMAPKDIRDTRLEICGECKFFTGKTCKKCGCLMSIKASLIATDCPLGIWDAKMVEEFAMGDLYESHIDEHLYKENCCG